MRKIWFSLSLAATLGWANLFVITDKSGKIVEEKSLTATNNASITQSATEYSLQAIYDELHAAEYQARRAEAARKRAEHFARVKAEAQRQGMTFSLTPAQKVQLLEDAKYYKGGRYVWGGITPQGFDCSGYVQYLYKKHNIQLPRTAWAQSQQGKEVGLNDLQKGDLLFFLTDKKRGIPVTHVGIYIGNGEFIHAASKKDGIIISPITHGKYANVFVKATRIIDSPVHIGA